MTLPFWILVGLTILAPIPFGAIYTWSWSLMGVVVGLLMSFWALQTAIAGDRVSSTVGRHWIVLSLFGVTVIWATLQWMPFMPDTWHHPLWRTASEILGLPLRGRISINPYETGSAVARILTYAGIAWLALQWGRPSEKARQAIFAVAIAGTVYAIYGLYVEFSGTQQILWFAKERYQDSLTSTFRYKNAYGAYAGLGLVCITGLLIKMASDAAQPGLGPRELARVILTRFFERGWPLLLGFVVIFPALLLSNSRGAVIATIVAIAVLALSAGLTRDVRLPFRKVFAGAIVVIFAAFLAFSGGRIIDRLGGSDTTDDARPRIYELTSEAIADFPWTGAGYGGFRDTFQIYRTPDLRHQVARAHSTYLDNALELGVPVAIALTLSVAGLGVICAVGVRRRQRNAIYPCIGLAATVLIAIHSTVDFVIQEPAVAATYFLIMGVACAQSRSSRSA